MASRLRRLFHLIVRPPAVEQQVDDEIRFHLATQTDELIAQGWPPETARAEAERRFGDRREAARDLVSLQSTRRVHAGRTAWWEAFRYDLRLAFRSLRREPGFTAVAILALGLGVGLTVAVVSVFNAAILRPLPYPNPDRLVQVWEHNRPRDQHDNLVAPANYLRWRERAKSFTGLELYTWDQRTLTDAGGAYRLNGYVVTPGLPGSLGVGMALGRPFRPEEAVPGAAAVIMLTDRTWRDRFGGDPGIIGRAVPLVEGSATVIGVLQPGTRLLDDEDYWAPYIVTPDLRTPRGRYTMVLGRLRNGVTLEAARAELGQIAAGLESELPEFDKGWDIEAVPLTDQVEGNGRPLVVVMLVAASFLLLIAVANVGNLFLGRALARADDHAVRAALGASLGRLARGWIAEAAVVAVSAGVLGAVAASWLIGALVRLAPANVPRLNELAFGPVAFATAAALTMMIGLVIGVLPAWAATCGRQAGTPIRGSLRTTADGSTLRLRDGLVAVQVALSVALLSGSGLLIRSLGHLMRIDPGVRTEGVLAVQLILPSSDFPDGARQALFYESLLDRLRAMPGVSSVGLASFLPIRGFIAGTPFSVEGAPAIAAGEKPSADIQTADSGFFNTLRVPILSGRGFSKADRAGPPVVIVNKTLADKYFPSGKAVGQRLFVEWNEPTKPIEIVGVVPDVRYSPLDRNIREAIYFSDEQQPSGGRIVLIASSTPADALTRTVRSAVATLAPRVPLDQVRTMVEVHARALASRRQPLILLGLFGAAAIVLTAVGLYGVLSYLVRQRTRELGIRAALGATSGRILMLVIRHGLVLVAAGLVLGTVLAVAGGRLLRGLLFGIGPTDPVTIAAVVTLVALVGLAASSLPARRAARLDPVEALRRE